MFKDIMLKNHGVIEIIHKAIVNAITKADTKHAILNVAIYTHIDADGKTAGAIIKHVIETEILQTHIESTSEMVIAPDIRISYIDYKESIPNMFDDEVYVPIVFFTDYSFDTIGKWEIVQKMYPNAQFVWIDHHVTSFDLLKDNKEYFTNHPNINFYMTQRICGALLAYNLCYRKRSTVLTELVDLMSYITNKYINGECNTFSELNDAARFHLSETMIHLMYNRELKWILYLSDYDCWNKILRKSNDFKMAYEAYGCPAETFLTNTPEECDALTTDMLAKGKLITVAFHQYFKDKYQPFMYEVNFNFTNHQYRMAVMNIHDNSLSFGDAINKYDICCAWHYQNGMYKYSIYSVKPDINCAEIAKEFGGGGHAGAAGFRSSELLFK